MYKDPLRNAYCRHKCTAERQRGIQFLLTFDEWKKIWEDSGHLRERGKLAHQYCMSRIGDAGPYAVGNVRIITNSENSREQRPARAPSFWRGKRLSEEHRARIRAGVLRHTRGCCS
jgi:hypothetical protein